MDKEQVQKALDIQRQALHFCRKQKIQTDVVKEKINYYECLEAALEKQISKKPEYFRDAEEYGCPDCGCIFEGLNYPGYCPDCGQKMDWRGHHE